MLFTCSSTPRPLESIDVEGMGTPLEACEADRPVVKPVTAAILRQRMLARKTRDVEGCHIVQGYYC